MKLVECDAGFGYDKTFFSIDLFGGENAEKGENGRLPVSDRAWTGRVIKCEPWVVVHRPSLGDVRRTRRTKEERKRKSGRGPRVGNY